LIEVTLMRSPKLAEFRYFRKLVGQRQLALDDLLEIVEVDLWRVHLLQEAQVTKLRCGTYLALHDLRLAEEVPLKQRVAQSHRFIELAARFDLLRQQTRAVRLERFGDRERCSGVVVPMKSTLTMSTSCSSSAYFGSNTKSSIATM
jgi:hypothetical protein